MNLYEIADSLQRVLDEIEHDGGYLTQELEERLNSLELQFQSKIENCLKYISSQEAFAESCDIEIARLKVKRDRAFKRAESLEAYMLKCMGADAKVETSIGRVWWRKSRRVEIEGEVPEQYIRVREVREPNKEEIKKDLECGASIPGARLIEKWSLQVR